MAAAALILAACQPEAPQPAEPPPPPEPVKIEPEPVVPTALNRGQLIAAADAAASAYAEGRKNDQASLIGRAFSIRIPFGCFGPQNEPERPDGLARWNWRDDGRAVRVTLTPAEWKAAPFLAAAWTTDAPPWESVEGLWIPQPWMPGEDCSKVVPLLGATASAQTQTLGLAAVFTADESRMGRRNGKAYLHTIRVDPAAATPATAGSYRVLVEGRVGAFASGSPIVCHADGPLIRPVCVVAFQPDRLAFENGDTGEILSEWRPG